jgi:Sulfotransferase domain
MFEWLLAEQRCLNPGVVADTTPVRAAVQVARRGELSISLQIIGPGFGRNGTRSLKAALVLVGFATCHHMQTLFDGPPISWTRV